MIEETLASVRKAESRLNGLRAQRAAMVQTIKDQRAAFVAHKNESRDLANAIQILQALLHDCRREVRQRVESITERAVQSVFGSHMRFQIEQDIKRGQVAMIPKVGYQRNGATEWSSMDQVGGGVRDVTSFALRVTLLAMMQSRVAQVIIADEPFKHVSDSRLPAVAEMVSELGSSVGIQLIIVSHEPEIAKNADRCFVVSMDPATGVSEILKS